MNLITVSVPNLINGVSQQADDLRFASQASEQINFYSSVVGGLQKRTPTNFLAEANTSKLSTSSFCELLKFNEDEVFMLLITGGTTPEIKVYDLSSGAERTVNNIGGTPVTPSDLTYLSVSSNMRKYIEALPVLDYVFLLNKTQVVASDTTVETARDPESLVFCKLVATGYDYTIDLFNDPTSTTPSYTASYTATSGQSQSDVISGLKTALDGAGANAAYTYSYDGTVMHVAKSDGSDFRIAASESAPNSLFAFKNSVQSIALLPTKGYAGFEIAVDGDADIDTDVFYVQYRADSGDVVNAFTEGSWVETSKKGIPYLLDASTMPHVLVKEADGTFTFKEETWDGRIAGDEETAPLPSIVGLNISEMFFFKNRLGLLAGESIVMSENDNYFNFFRTTILNLIDTDPIDVSANTNSLTLLSSATPFAERLVLSSGNTQFSLEGRELLTPESVAVTQTTSFSVLPNTRPCPVGDGLFFGFKRGTYSGVYKYRVRTDIDSFTADDVSEQIPGYIAGEIKQIVGVTTENIVAAITDDTSNPNYVYLYKFFERGQESLQSAWFKYDLGSDAEVVGMGFKDSDLYILLNRHDKAYIEYIKFAPGDVDNNTLFQARVDRKVKDTDCTNISYSSATDLTTIDLPYTPAVGQTVQVALRPSSSSDPVHELNNVTWSGNTVSIPGDYSTSDLWLGIQYDCEYVIDRPQVRQVSSSGRAQVVKSGTFMLREGRIAYDDTGKFKVTINPTFGTAYASTYTGSILNQNTTPNNPLSLDDGVFRFGIRQKNNNVSITLSNDSIYPCSLISIDWVGFYNTLARRI